MLHNTLPHWLKYVTSSESHESPRIIHAFEGKFVLFPVWLKNQSRLLMALASCDNTGAYSINLAIIQIYPADKTTHILLAHKYIYFPGANGLTLISNTASTNEHIHTYEILYLHMHQHILIQTSKHINTPRLMYI